MNSANITSSDRLKRVYRVLKDGKRHSTMSIIRKAGVCAVNSIVAELRDNGYRIECKRQKDKWLYRLAA